MPPIVTLASSNGNTVQGDQSAVLETSRRRDTGGEPPDNGDMETRVTQLEAVIPTLATKADLAQVEGKLIGVIERGINETQRWMLATVIGLFVGFGGLFLAMSNALKPAPATPQQPTVIVLPAQAQAPAASR